MSAQATSFSTLLRLVGAIVAVLWGIELLDAYLLNDWLQESFGIKPRSLMGLLGIAGAPFLHADFEHLIANTVPLVILMLLVGVRGRSELLDTTLWVALLGGFGTWLIGGGNENHVGASGVIFGFIGHLLARGFFDRSFLSLGLALLTGVLYGGALFGVVPHEEGVSWEGHLMGLLAGLLTGWVAAKAAVAPPAED